MECLNCNSGRLVYDKNSDSYICLDCNHKFPKQYFFISHSHLDIEKVRIIRNIIEETFFYEPILFFLKCLSDESELQNLIRREIYERIWFVYCKSKNAENSKYVCAEREYLQKLQDGGKKFNVVNIELDKFDIWDEKCYDYIRKQVEYQIRKTKLFISYSHYDRDAANSIYSYFSEHGYSVWIDELLTVGTSWFNQTKSNVKEHSYKDGCFVSLLSENAINSHNFRNEISRAIKNDAFIVPIICDNADHNTGEIWNSITTQFPTLKNNNYFVFDTQNPNSSTARLGKFIKSL